MFTSVKTFLKEWEVEASLTSNAMRHLTDEIMNISSNEQDRSLGRVAWHLAMTNVNFPHHFWGGDKPEEDADILPDSAEYIKLTFSRTSSKAYCFIDENLKDEDLLIVREAFGRQLTNGQILGLFLKHMIHHRGQMSTLFRIAGVKPPVIYGPSREDFPAL